MNLRLLFRKICSMTSYLARPLLKKRLVWYTYAMISRNIAPHFLKLLDMYLIVTVTSQRKPFKDYIELYEERDVLQPKNIGGLKLREALRR